MQKRLQSDFHKYSHVENDLVPRPPAGPVVRGGLCATMAVWSALRQHCESFMSRRCGSTTRVRQGFVDKYSKVPLKLSLDRRSSQFEQIGQASPAPKSAFFGACPAKVQK